MSYATQLFGAPVEGPVEGPKDARGAFLESQQKGFGKTPQFVITGPSLVNQKFEIYRTNFTYAFEPNLPWTPEQILSQLKKSYENSANPSAIAVQLKATILLDEGWKKVPAGNRKEAFDKGSDEPNPHLRGAIPGIVNSIASYGHWSTKIITAAEIEWVGLQKMLENLDRYDVRDDISECYGNRMSRVMISVNEYLQPRGAGIEEAKRALQLQERSLINLPAPSPWCGQACLAYAVGTESVRGNMRGLAAYALKEAEKMALSLGIEGPMLLSDFDKFVEIYGRRVVVMVNKTEYQYKSDNLSYRDVTYLLLWGGHYYYIADIDSFTRFSPRSTAVWCHNCLTSLTPAKLLKHACLQSCHSCNATFADKESREAHMRPTDKVCTKCNTKYAYDGCQHLCKRWACLSCKKSYPMERRTGHVCHEIHCVTCNVYFSEDVGHRCYIKRLVEHEARENPLIWAYDLECARGENGAQVLTVAVFKKLYTAEVKVCRSAEEAYDFISRLPRPTTLIAHNGAKYDTYLVFHELLKRSTVAPKTVFAGQKIIAMTWGGCTFLDSYRHLAMSLEAAARSFGGGAESKGFFPYDFYTVENYKYVGAVPGVEWFPERIRADPAFAAWHAAQTVYDIQEECIAYCIKDVDLLAEVLMRYRDSGIRETGVDPLTKATIASYALAAYRTRDMPAGVIPCLTPTEEAFARRALKGGRTDVRQVLVEFEPGSGQSLKYADVNSMYPWVMNGCPLPCGEPRWALQDELDKLVTRLSSGTAPLCLVECRVVPPRDLHHPVLVATDPDGRLRATLEPRDGVFTSVELQEALRQGYVVDRPSRALTFASSTDLFSSYIQRYYALKAEAAARGDRAGYALSKLMMNSLWGKFAQNIPPDDVVTYKNPQQWFRDLSLAACGKIDLEPMFTGDDYLVSRRSNERSAATNLSKTNVALAAFITSYGRLKLLSGLTPLGARVAYHDTDSIIYTCAPGETDPLQYGTLLGEWKDETAGDPIISFCGLGPKTYAYRTLSGVEEVKSKGFASGFSYDDYRTVAAAYFQDGARLTLTQECLNFRRKLGDGIHVSSGIKAMTPMNDKVHVVSARLTLPLGHQAIQA